MQPSGKPQFSFSRVRRGLRVVVPDRGRRRHPVRRSPLAGKCLQKTTQFFKLNLLQNWKGLSHEVTRLACFTGCRHQTELPEQEDQLRGRLNFRAMGGDRRPLRLQHQPRADADKASKKQTQSKGCGHFLAWKDQARHDTQGCTSLCLRTRTDDAGNRGKLSLVLSLQAGRVEREIARRAAPPRGLRSGGETREITMTPLRARASERANLFDDDGVGFTMQLFATNVPSAASTVK